MQFFGCLLYIGRHFLDSARRPGNSTEDIPADRCAEHLSSAREALLVRNDSAIEGASHPFHMFADAQITDPQLAERPVEIGKHSIEEALAEPARSRPLCLETMQIEKRMHTNQLKAPVECVRNAVIGEEDRLPRLLNHPLVRDVGGNLGTVACGSENHR